MSRPFYSSILREAGVEPYSFYDYCRRAPAYEEEGHGLVFANVLLVSPAAIVAPQVKNYWKLVRGHARPARFLAARLLMATGACRLFTIRQQRVRGPVSPGEPVVAAVDRSAWPRRSVVVFSRRT